jgi:hypothetical protein
MSGKARAELIGVTMHANKTLSRAKEKKHRMHDTLTLLM